MSNNNYRIYYIYLITNNIDGKNYVGQRCCPKDKTPETDVKYMGSGKYLRRSQEKYGIENFTKQIITVCYSKDVVDILEIEYIAIYKAIGKAEYNILPGGKGGDSDVTRSQWKNFQIRNKHRIGTDRYWNSPEGQRQKQINSEKQKGHKNTKGKHWYNNGIENVVADTCPPGYVSGRLGDFSCSEEVKQRKREKEKNMTEEQRRLRSERISKSRKGHITTEETKKHISEANRGRRYYNNGIIEVMAFECPEGFVPGRAPSAKQKIKDGMKKDV